MGARLGVDSFPVHPAGFRFIQRDSSVLHPGRADAGCSKNGLKRRVRFCAFQRLPAERIYGPVAEIRRLIRP